MATKATSKRGGSRVRSDPQVNSSTGLLGITFKLAHRKGYAMQPVICVIVGTRRFTRGVTRRGVRKAMQDAIKLRRDAGLQAPGLNRSLKAFNDWRLVCNA